MVELDEKSREIMRVLEDAPNSRASTNEVRRKLGCSNRAVNYRWTKLENHGLVEINYDDSLTKEGVAPMKVGVLTERGHRELDEGLAVTTDPELADTDARLDHLESRLDDLEETHATTQRNLDGLIRYVNENIVPIVAEAEDWMSMRSDDG